MSDGLPLIIIPAAGSSKRFKDVGIETPKGLIEFSYGAGFAKTMIQHVIPYDAERYMIVSNDQRYCKVDKQLQQFIHIDASRGQAETVGIACKHIPDQPILVLNNDAMHDYPLFAFCDQCKWASSGVLVFDGHNNRNFSYIDNFPLFTYAKEKQPISRWAVGGAYWFKSSRQVLDAVNKQLASGSTHAGEYYLSQTLWHIAGNKLAVVMDEKQVHGWDTPEDLARDRNVQVTDPAIEKILATLR